MFLSKFCYFCFGFKANCSLNLNFHIYNILTCLLHFLIFSQYLYLTCLVSILLTNLVDTHKCMRYTPIPSRIREGISLSCIADPFDRNFLNCHLLIQFLYTVINNQTSSLSCLSLKSLEIMQDKV